MSYHATNVVHVPINGRRRLRTGIKPLMRPMASVGNYIGVGDLAEDLLSTVQQTFTDVTSGASKTVSDDLSSKGGDIATNLINSSQFKIVLDKVQQKAEDGVKAVAGKNALALFGLALAAGTIGGAVLKGKLGLLGCTLLAGGSMFYIVSTNSTAADPTKGS